MIGRLRGILLWKSAPHVLVEVQGVGYEVEVTFPTFFKLPAVGQEMSLHTHLIVREDAHILYGFASEAERAMFRHLIKVNGVGAKMAATILSGIAVDDFVRCVRDNDMACLVKLPGVGKKTAERLVMEMRDRLDSKTGAAAPARAEAGMPPLESKAVNDAISAMVALGYKPTDASRMVLQVDSEGLVCEEIIRRALQAGSKS
ncbi:MAG: Holliday junction branch migration protein RuvA [Gammaproteobacteria bacterium]